MSTRARLIPAAMIPRDESELDFYSRRAMEEACLAAQAASPAVGAAHRRMAAAYAARMREEQDAADALGSMLADMNPAAFADDHGALRRG